MKSFCAVFLSNYGIGNSSPVLSMIEMLSESYNVDLYIRDARFVCNDVLSKQNVRIIKIRQRNIIASRVINMLGISKKYSHYVCFDPHGFVLCKEIYPQSKPIYYSLELYMSYDHYGLYYPPYIRKKERNSINYIRGLIIQSEEKEKLFREDYNLLEKIPSFILPVTNQGPPDSSKSDYIRKKYRISDNKKIALYLGELKWWYGCLEIAKQFLHMNDWVLIMHGVKDEDYVNEIRKTIYDEHIDNAYISDEFYESIDEVSQIIKSCDVGIAWYENITVGFRNVAWSSGKIASYLKFGLPVITTKYPGTIKAIENRGCGICIDRIEETPQAIRRLYSDYDTYSAKAIEEYEATYRFEHYRKALLDFINMPEYLYADTCCL